MSMPHDARLAALARSREATQFQPLDPASPSRPVQVRVPLAVLEQLDEAATAAGLTRSQAVRLAVEEWLAAKRRRS